MAAAGHTVNFSERPAAPCGAPVTAKGLNHVERGHDRLQVVEKPLLSYRARINRVGPRFRMC